MTIKPVNLLLAVLLSALLAYGLASLSGILKNYVAVGGGVFIFGTLAPIIAVDYENQRSAVSLRVLSAVFLVLGLLLNGIFALVFESATAYIVICSIAFLIYLFMVNAIYSTHQ